MAARDFLEARAGFFDERHTVLELYGPPAVIESGDTELSSRLEFFLRRWESPAAASDEFTGTAFHTWRLREVDGEVRVAAQMVDGFADLNGNSERLFGTPTEGLNT